ncbi:MAG: hypothetical protein HYR55_10755 [Acidobacteria bacterium]|nr:hypothetical protein [Acidobacteriota bacterium]
MKMTIRLQKLGLACGIGILLCSTVRAQEQPVRLSGAFTMAFSRTSITGRSLMANRDGARSQAHDLSTGLDLSVGSYLLDPRFIRFSFDTNFLRDKNTFDENSIRYGLAGINHSVEILPNSSYPFRFHFSKQRSSMMEREISSSKTHRGSLGYDWKLRKRHLPEIDVSYDRSAYGFNLAKDFFPNSRARSFFVGIRDNIKGWDLSSQYNSQGATGGMTNLTTDSRIARFDVRKNLSAQSSFLTSSFYETSHFAGDSRTDQNFTFFDVHSEVSTRLTKNISNRAFYQFYRSRSNLGKDDNVIIRAPESSGNGSFWIRPNTFTYFNNFGDQLIYRVRPDLTWTQAANASWIKPPVPEVESTTRSLELLSSVSWNRTLGLVTWRSGYTLGNSMIKTNFNAKNHSIFHSYNMGASAGNARRLLVSTDFYASRRPDIFQLGGYFKQNYFNAGLETHKLTNFRLSFSGGRTQVTTVTNRGKEYYRLTTFSANVDHRIFALTVARNVNVGIRDLFTSPLVYEPNRTFRRLPVSSLVHASSLDTSTYFTMVIARVRPARNLEIDIRYGKDKSLFVVTHNLFARQFDIIATYRLGKFTFSGGVLFDQQVAATATSRDRAYYFMRLSRPFKIF